ncbi:hypothetical protein [Arthrobacter alpinus]|uniref:hypothetical protein n=1 Tax=Arthrobacter alpinus TaxID=656366 RepID=UPI0037C0C254
MTSGKKGQRKGSRQLASIPGVSAKVYRRRRTVVSILALLIVVVLAITGFALFSLLSPSNGSAGDLATIPSADSTAETAVPAAKPDTPASAVCNEAGIKVSGLVDKTSFAANENPKLTLRVTNTGEAPCDINVGTSQMEFKITSGNDSIFNSKDCQADPTDLVKNLKPGASETANFTWKRNRSAQGCASVAAMPGGGGATYVFVATLGKWASDKVIFQLQ